MIYLSKGIPILKQAKEDLSVSHCGKLHKLTGEQATLWLSSQNLPGYTSDPEQIITLRSMVTLGIIEYAESEDDAALFRLLTNCTICPVRVNRKPALLNRRERYLWRWLRMAGLRLTMAELVFLAEKEIKTAPELLGESNRQQLTEMIYTTVTIHDSILESLMEAALARDAVVKAILGLLRKKKIYLI